MFIPLEYFFLQNYLSRETMLLIFGFNGINGD